LYVSLGSLRDVLIVATGFRWVPWRRRGPRVARDAVHGQRGNRFIALSGVAILNGLVLVTFIKQRLQSGVGLRVAVSEACQCGCVRC